MYIDWDDMAFKSVGWSSKSKVMYESGGGHYTESIDISSVSGIAPGGSLIAEYFVDDGDQNVGVASDTIIVGVGAERLREVWQLLGLDTDDPLIVSATERSTGATITQSITVVAGVVTVQRV
jgi:hypothetical protein